MQMNAAFIFSYSAYPAGQIFLIEAAIYFVSAILAQSTDDTSPLHDSGTISAVKEEGGKSDL
ncbi:hypothetical protein BJP26_00670 [Sphingomonas melonis TY]|nr:hypothetical protein BJP26_00670 [Sphingomonas melonis TY]